MPGDRLQLRTTIPAMVAGTALLDYLTSRFRYHDRATWEAHIAGGDIRVDGAPASPWLRLRRGMLVSYEVEHREPDVPTGIAVLHESPTLLAVDKPAGLPVHGDGVFIRNTLVHVLRQRLGVSVQPAHRLDRETSGVLVLGKDKASAGELQMCFQRGLVQKTYLAVVRGVVTDDVQTLTAPIGPAPDSRITLRRAVLCAGAPGAATASTHVRVRARGRSRTLVEVTPHTGRTHQIRVHLAAIGHALLGDVLYGRSDDDYLAFVQHVKAGGDAAWPAGRDAPRHMLHAARIELPTAAGSLVVEAPTPADMIACLEEREND